MSEEDFARWDALEAEVRGTERGEPASPTPPPPPVEPAAEPVPAVDPPAGDGPTVLLADSDGADRHVLAEALRAQGWTTRVAIDGPEALIEIYRERPDCLVLDLALDGLGGLELLARIHEEGVVDGLCVVAHSSMSEPVHVHQAKALGVDRFLARDADHADALVQVVREQLIDHGLDVPPAPERSAAGNGDPTAFRSPFGRGGGPPGSVPRSFKQAVLGQVPTD